MVQVAPLFLLQNPGEQIGSIHSEKKNQNISWEDKCNLMYNLMIVSLHRSIQ